MITVAVAVRSIAVVGGPADYRLEACSNVTVKKLRKNRKRWQFSSSNYRRPTKSLVERSSSIMVTVSWWGICSNNWNRRSKKAQKSSKYCRASSKTGSTSKGKYNYLVT